VRRWGQGGHGKVKGRGKVIMSSRVGDVIDGGFTHVLRRVGDRAVLLLRPPHCLFYFFTFDHTQMNLILLL